jgi:hypothetical protein
MVEPPMLTLVDLEVGPLRSDTARGMFDTLAGMAPGVRGLWSDGVLGFVPEIYLDHARNSGCPAHAVPQAFLRDVPGLALDAAGHIHGHRFKVAGAAAEKARTLPLSASLTFRLGERLEDDALKLSVLLGVKLCLTDAPVR